MVIWSSRSPALLYALCIFSCISVEPVLAQGTQDKIEQISIGIAAEWPYLDAPLGWLIDQTNFGVVLVSSTPEETTLLYEFTFGRWNIDPYPREGQTGDWFRQQTGYGKFLGKLPDRIDGYLMRFQVGHVMPLINLGDVRICNVFLVGYQKKKEVWNFGGYGDYVIGPPPPIRIDANQVVFEFRLRATAGRELTGPAFEVGWCWKKPTSSTDEWNFLVSMDGLSLRAYLPVFRRKQIR